MSHALLDRLAEAPLLVDGAMGTMLYAAHGGAPDACFDALNVQDGRAVQAVHAEYVAAGADILETNTFGANRFKLAPHGLESRVREINRAGARLARDAREAMGRDVLVLGSLGPLGRYLSPLGSVSEDEALAAFREQAEGLLDGGVDGFVAETFSDLREIRLAVQAIRSVSADLPIVAQVAFTEECVTFVGDRPAEVARELAALPVQAIGANCSVGSSVLYDVLVLLRDAAPGVPVCVQPNAGLPARLGERLMYLSSPAYMAELAGRMLDAGARLVGGCCGTTPAHIRAMREVIDRHVPDRARPRRAVLVSPPASLRRAGVAPRRGRAHPPPALARGRRLPRHGRAGPAARPQHREARPGRRAAGRARRGRRGHQRRLPRPGPHGGAPDRQARAARRPASTSTCT